MASLIREAFTTDLDDVHTYLINFISGNETAEAKIQAYDKDNTLRLDKKYLSGN